jgi:16S rRNA (guanine527-N7)-methyltransferase
MPSPMGPIPAISRIRSILLELSPEHAKSDATLSALQDWLTQLQQWNRKINLTAARSDDELLDLFIADAAVLHRARFEVGPSEGWLDVGAGAGAPGLAMAILDPGLRIDLAEPNAKRVAFLRHVIGRLGLTQTKVVSARVEGLPAPMADDVVSRATFSPQNWLTCGLRLTRRRLWLLLARENWQSPPDCTIVYDRSYRWPLTGAERRVVAVTLPTK